MDDIAMEIIFNISKDDFENIKYFLLGYDDTLSYKCEENGNQIKITIHDVYSVINNLKGKIEKHFGIIVQSSILGLNIDIDTEKLLF